MSSGSKRSRKLPSSATASVPEEQHLEVPLPPGHTAFARYGTYSYENQRAIHQRGGLPLTPGLPPADPPRQVRIVPRLELPSSLAFQGSARSRPRPRRHVNTVTIPSDGRPSSASYDTLDAISPSFDTLMPFEPY